MNRIRSGQVAPDNWVKLLKAQGVKFYPVGLVGEQFVQDAVSRLKAGHSVRLWHEYDNPHDAGAILATGPDGHAIGYVPRDNFLRRVLLEDRGEYTARVLSLYPKESDKTDVVIEVALQGAQIDPRPFRR